MKRFLLFLVLAGSSLPPVLTAAERTVKILRDEGPHLILASYDEAAPGQEVRVLRRESTVPVIRGVVASVGPEVRVRVTSRLTEYNEKLGREAPVFIGEAGRRTLYCVATVPDKPKAAPPPQPPPEAIPPVVPAEGKPAEASPASPAAPAPTETGEADKIPEGNPVAWYIDRGDVELEAGNIEFGYRLYRTAFELDPGDPVLKKKLDAAQRRVLLARTTQYYERGDLAAATEYWGATLNLYPDTYADIVAGIERLEREHPEAEAQRTQLMEMLAGYCLARDREEEATRFLLRSPGRAELSRRLPDLVDRFARHQRTEVLETLLKGSEFAASPLLLERRGDALATAQDETGALRYYIRAYQGGGDAASLGQKMITDPLFIAGVQKSVALKKNPSGYWEATFAPGDVTMIYLPAGEFTMGTEKSAADADTSPAHKVALPGYWFQKTEITVTQYLAFSREDPGQEPEWRQPGHRQHIETGKDNYYRKLAPAIQVESCPVMGVTWENAAAFARWFAGQTGLPFRLPSEAEWERAARGDDGRIYPWGPLAATPERARYATDKGQAATLGPISVGSLPAGASPCGALDLAGNVWEWVADWYAADTYRQPSSTAPTGPASGSARVIRGGSWKDTAAGLLSFRRDQAQPTRAAHDGGFRLAMGGDVRVTAPPPAGKPAPAPPPVSGSIRTVEAVRQEFFRALGTGDFPTALRDYVQLTQPAAGTRDQDKLEAALLEFITDHPMELPRYVELFGRIHPDIVPRFSVPFRFRLYRLAGDFHYARQEMDEARRYYRQCLGLGDGQSEEVLGEIRRRAE